MIDPIASAVAAAETTRRSLRASLLITAVAVVVACALPSPLLASFRGALTPAAIYALVGAAWGVFVLAALAHHRLGAPHVVTRAICAADVVAWRLCTLALVYLTQAPSSPAWVLTIVTGFSFTPRSELAHRRLKRVLIAGVVCLALLCLWDGHTTTAIWMLVVLHSVVIVLTVVHDSVMQGLRVRAERDLLRAERDRALLERDRDRFVRDLHDATGADLTALVLSLRRATRALPAEAGSDLSSRAQRVLDSLRHVVRDLRRRNALLGLTTEETQ
jgi:signal transduction histidine kinase